MAHGFSAKDARVKIDTTFIEANEWSVATKADTIDTTGFEDKGFGDAEAGVRTAEVSIKGYWDSTKNLHDSPPSIYEGAVVQNVKCYLSNKEAYTAGAFVGAPGVAYDFPKLLVTEVNVTAVVREGVKYDFKCMTKGPYTAPGEATS